MPNSQEVVVVPVAAAIPKTKIVKQNNQFGYRFSIVVLFKNKHILPNSEQKFRIRAMSASNQV